MLDESEASVCSNIQSNSVTGISGCGWLLLQRVRLAGRSMRNTFLFWAAVSGFFCVALGAFGAHALEAVLDEAMLEVWQTAVQYQMFHVAGLIGVHVLIQNTGEYHVLVASGRLMLAGMLVFSGSLYLLALTGVRWLGMITPIGGVCLLVAWILLGVSCFRQSGQE